MSGPRHACLFIYLFTHGRGKRPIQYQRPGKHDPSKSMLVYCWASVTDSGPTLSQHWFNVIFINGILLKEYYQ